MGGLVIVVAEAELHQPQYNSVRSTARNYPRIELRGTGWQWRLPPVPLPHGDWGGCRDKFFVVTQNGTQMKINIFHLGHRQQCRGFTVEASQQHRGFSNGGSIRQLLIGPNDELVMMNRAIDYDHGNHLSVPKSVVTDLACSLYNQKTRSFEDLLWSEINHGEWVMINSTRQSVHYTEQPSPLWLTTSTALCN